MNFIQFPSSNANTIIKRRASLAFIKFIFKLLCLLLELDDDDGD